MSKKNKFSASKFYAALIIGTLIATIATLTYICEYFYRIGKPDQIPAWFQAIGSIAAILFAFLISILQSERNLAQAKQLKEEEIKQQMTKVLHLVKLANHHSRQVVDTIIKTPITNADYPPEIMIIFLHNWKCYQDILQKLRNIDCFYYPTGVPMAQMMSYLAWQDYVSSRFISRANQYVHWSKPMEDYDYDLLNETTMKLFLLLIKDETNKKDFIDSMQKGEAVFKDTCETLEKFIN